VAVILARRIHSLIIKAQDPVPTLGRAQDLELPVTAAEIVAKAAVIAVAIIAAIAAVAIATVIAATASSSERTIQIQFCAFKYPFHARAITNFNVLMHNEAQLEQIYL
jgi:hypothetical protein